mgnify:CR=1 FL=1
MWQWIWLGSIIATTVMADQKKRSVLGFFFLACLTGPLAVLIIALTSERKAENNSTVGTDSPENIVKEYHILKNAVLALNKRLEKLESSIQKMADNNLLSSDKPSVVLPASKNIARPAASLIKDEKFELVFGKYWLNRVGIIVFVLGVGFFISYSFQYLGAFAKIAIGYVASALLLGWGMFLEKKEKYTKVSWGILGGAWGLLYLSTYAMHYIAATRIIDSPILESLALTIVSIAVIIYNLKYKFWIVTALTFALAFITLRLGSVDASLIFYCGLLSSAIVFISWRFNWIKFLVLSIFASYVTYASFGSWSCVLTSGCGGKAAIHLGILSISAVIFIIGLLLMKAKDQEDVGYLVSGQLINAGFLACLSYPQLRYWGLDQSKISLVLLALAAVYFAVACVYQILTQKKMLVVSNSIAFALIAAALFIRNAELGMSFLWSVEMAVLFVLGIYYKERIYRIFSACLGIIIVLRLYMADFHNEHVYQFLGLALPHNVLIFSFVAACFFIMVAMVKDSDRGLSSDERNIFYGGGPVVGTVLLTSLLLDVVIAKWLSLSWTLLGLLLLSAGFFFGNKVYRLCALGVLSVTCCKVVFMDMAGVNTIYKILAFLVLGIVMVGISLVYSRFDVKDSDEKK